MAKQKHNIVPELAALMVPIDSVQPHPDNAREGDVDFLRGKLKEFGQYQVLVADAEGLLAVGNHRWHAMKAEGWTHVAAVRRDLDAATARRLRVADNASSDRAGYDQAKLLSELRAITDEALARAGEAATDDGEAQKITAQALEEVGFEQTTLDGLQAAVDGTPRGKPATAPESFDDPEAGMKTDFQCPQCAYEWSGQPKPNQHAAPAAEAA